MSFFKVHVAREDEIIIDGDSVIMNADVESHVVVFQYNGEVDEFRNAFRVSPGSPTFISIITVDEEVLGQTSTDPYFLKYKYLCTLDSSTVVEREFVDMHAPIDGDDWTRDLVARSDFQAVKHACHYIEDPHQTLMAFGRTWCWFSFAKFFRQHSADYDRFWFPMEKLYWLATKHLTLRADDYLVQRARVASLVPDEKVFDKITMKNPFDISRLMVEHLRCRVDYDDDVLATAIVVLSLRHLPSVGPMPEGSVFISGNNMLCKRCDKDMIALNNKNEHIQVIYENQIHFASAVVYVMCSPMSLRYAIETYAPLSILSSLLQLTGAV